MNYIDLHVHTNCSDGTLSPKEVVALAAKKGLSHIAITDHDTLSGIPEAIAAAEELKKQGTDITVIPGVEISVSYKGRDIHILGLYVDCNCMELTEALEEAIASRDARNEKIAANLRADHIPVTLKDLMFGVEDTVITRSHFARYLIEHGYAKNNMDAFKRYLEPGTKYYVPREYMAPEKAIALIKKAKGLPVLAHPLLYHYNQSEINELIAAMCNAGIAGIETIYSANTGLDEGIVRRYANHNHLLMTGGSDFHGANKPHIELGTGRGNLKIPESLLPPIQEYLSTHDCSQ